MARSTLAGMDILMIAKTDFLGAWTYFQSLLAGQLSAAEQAGLVADAHETDFPTLQAKFKARVTESAARIKAAKTQVGPVANMMGTGPATNASQDLVGQYQQLTQ